MMEREIRREAEESVSGGSGELGSGGLGLGSAGLEDGRKEGGRNCRAAGARSGRIWIAERCEGSGSTRKLQKMSLDLFFCGQPTIGDVRSGCSTPEAR
jgi:hypothetical protein